MTERLTICPECKDYEPIIVKIHNPETHDMNANATFECEGCHHIWDGRTASPFYIRERERGFII